MDAIKKHFTEAQAVLTAFIADEKNLQAIEAAGQLMVSALANGKKIISCVGNDYGYDFIFSRYLEALANEGDVLVGISTSGNSKNIINAVATAKSKGVHVVCLTGKDGGQLAGLADVEIRAPKSDYADRAQEIHIKVIHSLIDFIERHQK